ncbi:MAG: TonB-dependent receptor [Candidatus Brocadia sinica]|nr:MULTISPECIES: TonB-dependent receptor [Brocadia]MCK6469925.1 TonB-dependent receptor [Candidatus Brocadia sinica]
MPYTSPWGARHDQYSDFGGATSPRSGLTWAFMKNASLKLLYGEAFRPPNFQEMFTTNQPAIEGNKDLDPETIRTYEVGLSYQFNKHVTSSVNYFYNDIEDLIVLRTAESANEPARFENFGDAHVQGVEMETRVDITKDNYVFMNYTFQNPEDNHGNDLPSVAQHKGNFGMNVHYWKYINTNLSTFVSGTRSRKDDNPRDDLPAYALLNLSIIAKEFFKTMEVQGTVFNLLDKDYSDPGPMAIPDDLPRPGRTFFVGLSYQF